MWKVFIVLPFIWGPFKEFPWEYVHWKASYTHGCVLSFEEKVLQGPFNLRNRRTIFDYAGPWWRTRKIHAVQCKHVNSPLSLQGQQISMSLHIVVLVLLQHPVYPVVHLFYNKCRKLFNCSCMSCSIFSLFCLCSALWHQKAFCRSG